MPLSLCAGPIARQIVEAHCLPVIRNEPGRRCAGGGKRAAPGRARRSVCAAQRVAPPAGGRRVPRCRSHLQRGCRRSRRGDLPRSGNRRPRHRRVLGDRAAWGSGGVWICRRCGDRATQPPARDESGGEGSATIRRLRNPSVTTALVAGVATHLPGLLPDRPTGHRRRGTQPRRRGHGGAALQRHLVRCNHRLGRDLPGPSWSCSQGARPASTAGHDVTPARLPCSSSPWPAPTW